jgi:hypothetical protein
MASDDQRDFRPTVPLHRPPRCRAGHDQPRNPTWNPELGLVPALSSVIVGGILVALAMAAAWWLFPPALPWLIGLVVVGLIFSAAAQLLSGHRGTCLLRRTLRWWLGPIGSLVDPIEMG